MMLCKTRTALANYQCSGHRGSLIPPDPPTLQELQADILRRQRLQDNVRAIEAREREERERLAVEQSEALKLGQPQQVQVAVREPPQNLPPRGEPKDVEDPWAKARREAPPEQPSSWQPTAVRSEDSFKNLENISIGTCFAASNITATIRRQTKN
ncbi:transport protein [Ceratobasidium sp. AG-Ba]|nr:transport protein [Ceratobasidium sp. AG-Ba]